MSFHPRLTSLINKTPPAETISIVLGELVSLTEGQLHLQWKELVKDTPLARATLRVRIIRAEQQCMVCFEKYHPVDTETQCPYCMSTGAKILTGEEFYIESNRE